MKINFLYAFYRASEFATELYAITKEVFCFIFIGLTSNQVPSMLQVSPIVSVLSVPHFNKETHWHS